MMRNPYRTVCHCWNRRKWLYTGALRFRIPRSKWKLSAILFQLWVYSTKMNPIQSIAQRRSPTMCDEAYTVLEWWIDSVRLEYQHVFTPLVEENVMNGSDQPKSELVHSIMLGWERRHRAYQIPVWGGGPVTSGGTRLRNPEEWGGKGERVSTTFQRGS